MPATTHIFPKQKLIVSQFQGIFKEEVLLEYYRKLLSIADDSIEYNELVDFRQIENGDISVETLSGIAAEVSAAYKGIEIQVRCAVVASSDLIFGMSRLYEMGKAPEKISMQVFRDISEALEWLDILEPDFRKELDELTPDNPSALHILE